ncbi:MAG: 3-oxoacyl-ACP synthase III [Deltaproteobacteria bacterium]|nr:3-oxoacyl-ACP synthase III [Deltaproteobacteria bacterium]
MRFENVSILSVASLDAPNRTTSADLEARLSPFLKRLGFAPGVLASLSGVIARRFWDEGTAPSEVAAKAAERAITEAGVERARIGLLVNTSVSRDYVEPSTACLVHGKLGLHPTCLNFDVANACLGFINGMDLVAQSIERGVIDYGLVVDGESSRFVVDKTIERLNATGDARAFADHFATLTLGSGAAAMLLSHKDLAGPEAHRYVGSVSLAATEHSHLCRGQVDGMITDGQKLLQAGLELARRTFELASTELGWSPEVLDEIAIHQVSRQHTDKLAERLGLDPSRIHAIFPELGNVGPASIPLVLTQAAELGRLSKGDRVALMGIGSGLNCAMAEVVW